jgi:hypothetical protein
VESDGDGVGRDRDGHSIEMDGDGIKRGMVLELVAYINTNGRPSRRERSERRDSNVHGAGVF